MRRAYGIGSIVALLTVMVLLEGCASEWTMREQRPLSALQWPNQPAMSRIAYVSSMNGFERGGSASSVVKNVIFGLSGDVNSDAFGVPVAVAAGQDGRLAVADSGCRCVHWYLPTERKYLRIASTGSGELKSPVSVVFDDEQRLYVSDSVAGRILVFGSDGVFLAAISASGTGSLKRPTGLAYDRKNRVLYAVDTADHQVHAFDRSGNFLFSFGERGDANGQFNFPTHIAWSPAGLLYVTDAMNFRIQIFDEQGRFRTAFGHHGDMSGDLAMPKGVAADRNGTVYVVDALFDALQLFNERGEFLLTVGSRGNEFGEFYMPSGIFIDDADRLYLCDTYNRRIQIFSITGNGAYAN
ncbi:MAG: hypothetical protein HZA15_07655 [Nitrospirae bacterium]|nr:hypothetical protein [Nitrospirota bacterium]